MRSETKFWFWIARTRTCRRPERPTRLQTSSDLRVSRVSQGLVLYAFKNPDTAQTFSRLPLCLLCSSWGGLFDDVLFLWADVRNDQNNQIWSNLGVPKVWSCLIIRSWSGHFKTHATVSFGGIPEPDFVWFLGPGPVSQCERPSKIFHQKVVLCSGPQAFWILSNVSEYILHRFCLCVGPL